jgi:hypothetical protein
VFMHESIPGRHLLIVFALFHFKVAVREEASNHDLGRSNSKAVDGGG